jgi:hypothetical protein
MRRSGCSVKIADDYVPTPAVYAVKSPRRGWRRGDFGPTLELEWGSSGKFADPHSSTAKSLETELAAGGCLKERREDRRRDQEKLRRSYISSFADLSLIAKAKFKLAVDAMYGSDGALAGFCQTRH